MTIQQLDLVVAYQEPDVVSAQRLRFRHSSRLKVLLVLGLVVLLVPLAQFALPGLLGAGLDLAALAWLAAVFLLAPALTYLLGPFIDFRRNATWRTPLDLRLSAAGMRLAVADAPAEQAAIEVGWEHLHHLLENEDVIILFFGEQQSYIIVPKRLLARPGELEFVHGLVRGRDPAAGAQDR